MTSWAANPKRQKCVGKRREVCRRRTDGRAGRGEVLRAAGLEGDYVPTAV